MQRNNRGFTLIEVLIAAVIMFAVLALTAVSFKTARQSSEKAANVVNMLAPLPLIMDTIRTQIRSNPLENLHGDGAFSGISYQWQADSQLFLSPPNIIDPETMLATNYQPRYRLYQVNLTLSLGNQQRQLSYKELAWTAQSVFAE